MRGAVKRSRAFLAAALFSALAMSPSAGAEDGERLVRAFAVGTGDANVGVSVGETGRDQEEEGPQALASGDGGKLFLLDQVNRRILKFDPNDPAAPAQPLDLPSDLQPTDLVVKGSSIYVWSGRPHALIPGGPRASPSRSLTETRAAEPVDDGTRTAFAQMGSVEDDTDLSGAPTRAVVKPNRRNDLARQVVETMDRGKVVVSVALTDKGAGAILNVRPDAASSGRSVKLRLHVRDRLGTVAFLDIDHAGRSYVLAENIPNNIRDAAFVFVARYSPAGILEGVFEVPLTSTTVSRRCVTVSRDGAIYFLKTLKSGVEVVGLGFRATPNAKTIEFARYQPNLAAASWTQTTGISIAVGPLSRQKILASALSYEGIQWTVTPRSYGTQDSCSGFRGRIRVPMYIIGKQGETVRGVPYCWGCQGSVSQFMNRLQKGTMAGNVCTKDGIRSDVTGVDCSSFVSATWGLSTHFTTAVIPTIARQLSNPWDLLPGDALDKPGSHVVLFLGFTPNREALVMEASPGACQGRVCRNIYPLSWLLSRGFIPVRYKALEG